MTPIKNYKHLKTHLINTKYMKNTKESTIDYYGDKANYIHLKFGRARKMYNFTTDFIKQYPDFSREYAKYFEMKESKFENPFQIVSYVYNAKIPVHFYFNYTDKPAKNKKEVIDYLVRENDWSVETGELYLKN